jgi:hypothetical protein
MKFRFVVNLLLASLLAASSAWASTTWYVNGATGSDSNNCLSPTAACKTIGHAISLALSGDSIRVAAATCKENLSIRINLTIVGSGATTTIIDGGGVGTVVTISNRTAHVTLSRLSIRNGVAPTDGGGIYNLGTLALLHSAVSGNKIGSGCSQGCSVLGGGIYNGGTLTISTSTVSGNSASLRWRYR